MTAHTGLAAPHPAAPELAAPDLANGQVASSPPTGPESAPPCSGSVWARVLAAAAELAASPQPAVVLASLAALSVPTLSDSCHVLVQEDTEDHDAPAAADAARGRPGTGGVRACGGGRGSGAGQRPAYRVGDLPLAGHDPFSGWVAEGGTVQQITGDTVTTTLVVPALVGVPGYHGVVVHHWTGGYRPGAADAALAGLLVQRAVSLLHTERQSAQLTKARATVGQLEEAVATNRDIGAAVGILMHSHHLGYDEAFRALVTTSQYSNTKLRTICRRVLFERTLRDTQ